MLEVGERLSAKDARVAGTQPSSTATTGSATSWSTRRGARIAAVLDWELGAIGDPRADLGYLVATYSEPGGEGSTRWVVAGDGHAGASPHARS